MSIALREPVSDLPLGQDPMVLLGAAALAARASVPAVPRIGRGAVPVVPRARNRFTRSIKRAVTNVPSTMMGRGATSMFRAIARMPDTRKGRMAAALLKAAGLSPKGVPVVSHMDVLRRQADRYKAQTLVMRLRDRFRRGAEDMADGVADLQRTAKAVARGYAIPAMA